MTECEGHEYTSHANHLKLIVVATYTNHLLQY